MEKTIWEGKGYIRAALIFAVIAGVMTWEYNDTIKQKQARIQERIKYEEKAQVDAATQRIATFIDKKTQYPGDPVVLAKKIRQKKHPKTLAAIMKVESNGRIEARGKVGEMGLFQIRPEFWGPVSHEPEKMVDHAADVLETLVRESGGKIDVAVRKYNGSGPKAARYAMKVAQVRNNI